MSQAQIDKLKNYLESELGLSLAEEEDEVQIYHRGRTVTISVEIEVEDIPLPEVLQPYQRSEGELARYFEKGISTEKQSWSGVSFELALSDYAHARLDAIPERQALVATLYSITTKEGFEEYDAKKLEIWKELWRDPELIALKKDLEENYL